MRENDCFSTMAFALVGSVFQHRTAKVQRILGLPSHIRIRLTAGGCVCATAVGGWRVSGTQKALCWLCLALRNARTCLAL